MDSFLYDDDVENEQSNVRRLALTEESLNRTLLLHNRENNVNYYFWLSMYILVSSIVVIVIILIIIAYKHLI